MSPNFPAKKGHYLVGGTKIKILLKLIKGINPKATIKAIPRRCQVSEAAIYLRDCDVIFGCVDSFAARRDLEAAARRYLIPYIDIGMDVHSYREKKFSISGQVVVSMPGEPCLRCLGFLTDELINTEAQNYGAAGGKPQVVWPNGILASFAVGLFIQLLTPWHNEHLSAVYLEYDGNRPEVTINPCLTQILKKNCTHFDKVNSVGDPFFSFPSEDKLNLWSRFKHSLFHLFM